MSLSKKERKVQYLEVLSLLRKDDLDGAYNALALMCGQDTDLFILAPRTKNPKGQALTRVDGANCTYFAKERNDLIKALEAAIGTYCSEHGYQEPDTGAYIFDNEDVGQSYCDGLESAIEIAKNLKCKAMPWSELLSEGWRIVGMNHYNLAGETHLFCSMTKGEKCITSEGPDEVQVFRDLEKKAGFGLEESVPESEPGPDSVPQHKGVYER